MATFARSLSVVANLRSVVARRPALGLGSAALPLVAVLLAAAPASAVVTVVGPTTVGVQPHSAPVALETGEPASFSNASGNPVLHTNSTYAIYWDPTRHYHGDWEHLVNNFLQNVGAAGGSLESVFAVDTQYTDKSNQPASNRSTFRGAYTDTNAYPTAGCKDPKPLEPADRITCLTDTQIRERLEAFISSHGLQKGMSTIFYLLTPPGVTVCVDAGASASHCSSNSASANSFCSYHSDISPTSPVSGDGNTILYAMIPWTAGGLGDFHLAGADQTPAFDCQDGGFDPSSKPSPEKKEKAKEKSAKETTEFNEKTTEEKEKQEKAEALEGPHQQEPNQSPCPTTDGGCDRGLADVIINQIAVEQQNTVTDPLLNAWQDPGGKEATDECRNFFAPVLGGSVIANEETGAGSLFNQSLSGGTYYLNSAFNLAAFKLPYPGVACLTHADLVPSFTAPNPVSAGDIVGFDGMESDVTLGGGINFPGGGGPQPTYATYTWDFGDGTPTVSGFAPGAAPCTAPWLTPCAGSVFHSYQYGGPYDVTLTVTDVGGNTASVTHSISVVGPLKASGTSGGSGQATQGAAGSTTPGVTAGVTAGVTPKAVANPVASATVMSRSLLKVLRQGLVIRYSVNEQVTGHFDVLLDRSIARRLGISGAPATGLPAGSAPSVVIARAILVTTKGGRNTVKIQFSKRTAARLRRLRKVSLTLKLVVRNASSQSPASTTVLTAVTLTR